MENVQPQHSLISPTAKLVAYWRKFSDIPYAAEVARLIHAEEAASELVGQGEVADSLPFSAPYVEARYKSMVSAIQKERGNQVLEFASGLSLRGLAMTKNPDLTYVETDLPGITEEKLALVSHLLAQNELAERKNLFFRAVNILSMPQIETALRHFSTERPLTVVHEGLFQYLSIDEKETAARNVHVLLSRFGGVWITPDFCTKAEFGQHPLWSRADMMKMAEGISRSTQRDFFAHAFEDDAHIEQFFTALGFKIEVTSQCDGTYELSSAKKLGLSSDARVQFGDNMKLWKLRIA